ncbi:MAG: hypothetical protein ACFNLP_02435 [Segatella oulorum]
MIPNDIKKEWVLTSSNTDKTANNATRFQLNFIFMLAKIKIIQGNSKEINKKSDVITTTDFQKQTT